MTENDLSVAKDIGSLQADMRTVKHDVAGISAKIDGLSHQIGQINTEKAKGVGFFAGVTAVFGTAGALVIFLFKIAFPGVGQ